MIATIGLHGFCFGFFFVVAQMYVDRAASRRHQGVGPEPARSSSSTGSGTIVGSVLSGELLQAIPSFTAVPDRAGRGSGLGPLVLTFSAWPSSPSSSAEEEIAQSRDRASRPDRRSQSGRILTHARPPPRPLRRRRHAAARASALRRLDQAGRRVDDPLRLRGVVLKGAGRRSSWPRSTGRASSTSRTGSGPKRLADAAHTTPDRVALHCVHQHNAPFIDREGNALLRKAGASPLAL